MFGNNDKIIKLLKILVQVNERCAMNTGRILVELEKLNEPVEFAPKVNKALKSLDREIKDTKKSPVSELKIVPKKRKPYKIAPARKAMERYTLRDRKDIVEWVRTGMSYEDIAKKLGRSVKAIQNQVYRLRKQGVDLSPMYRGTGND